MRKACVVIFLIGVALVAFSWHVIHVTPNLTPEEIRAVAIVFGAPGGFLMIFGGVWWIRLTIFGWFIHFTAYNWYQGKEDYELEDAAE
jgi:hypothetical protein